MPKNHVYATAYKRQSRVGKTAAAQFSLREPKEKFALQIAPRKGGTDNNNNNNYQIKEKEKLEPDSNACFLAFHFEFNLTAFLAFIFRFSNARGSEANELSAEFELYTWKSPRKSYKGNI